MQYTLDAKINSQKIVRLTRNNDWRFLSNSWALQDIDRLYEEYNFVNSDLIRLTLRNEGYRYPKYFPRIHREHNIKIFTKDELIKVISGGDDSSDNMLVVEIDGNLKLYDEEKIEIINEKKIPIAVRHERFIAGNDYIGANAAEDMNHITQLYEKMLNGLHLHLTTGMIYVFADESIDTDSRILEKIGTVNAVA